MSFSVTSGFISTMYGVDKVPPTVSNAQLAALLQPYLGTLPIAPFTLNMKLDARDKVLGLLNILYPGIDSEENSQPSTDQTADFAQSLKNLLDVAQTPQLAKEGEPAPIPPNSGGLARNTAAVLGSVIASLQNAFTAAGLPDLNWPPTIPASSDVTAVIAAWGQLTTNRALVSSALAQLNQDIPVRTVAVLLPGSTPGTTTTVNVTIPLNESLQEVLETEYVEKGSSIIFSGLQSLVNQQEQAKTGLGLLTELQQVYNGIQPVAFSPTAPITALNTSNLGAIQNQVLHDLFFNFGSQGSGPYSSGTGYDDDHNYHYQTVVQNGQNVVFFDADYAYNGLTSGIDALFSFAANDELRGIDLSLHALHVDYVTSNIVVGGNQVTVEIPANSQGAWSSDQLVGNAPLKFTLDISFGTNSATVTYNGDPLTNLSGTNVGDELASSLQSLINGNYSAYVTTYANFADFQNSITDKQVFINQLPSILPQVFPKPGAQVVNGIQINGQTLTLTPGGTMQLLLNKLYQAYFQQAAQRLIQLNNNGDATADPPVPSYPRIYPDPSNTNPDKANLIVDPTAQTSNPAGYAAAQANLSKINSILHFAGTLITTSGGSGIDLSIPQKTGYPGPAATISADGDYVAVSATDFGTAADGTLEANLRVILQNLVGGSAIVGGDATKSGYLTYVNSGSNQGIDITNWILGNWPTGLNDTPRIPNTNSDSALDQTQSLLTNAFSSASSLNDALQQQLKQSFFLFQQFVQSATSALSSINKIITKMAQNISNR